MGRKATVKIVEFEGADIEAPDRYTIEAGFWDMELISMGLHNLIAHLQDNTKRYREKIAREKKEFDESGGERGTDWDMEGPDLADQLFDPTEKATRELLDGLVSQLGYDPANG